MNMNSTPVRFSSTLMITLGLLASGCGGGSEEPTSSTPASEPVAEAPAAPPPSAVPMGSSGVAGSIVFAGEAPRLKPISMDADPGCASKHEGAVSAQFLVLGEGQSLGNVFVQVKNPPEGAYTPPAEPAIIDQRGCLYEPHVLGVVAGQTLQFRNSDGLLHNVHGLPKENREFNLGMPPTVAESNMTLNRPEPVFPVKCDVHPWMRSYVAVLAHPFFAVTGESGEYRIEGLPAGTYELEAWHEKLGVQTTSLTVAEGETGAADFSFGVPTGG